MDKDVAIVGWAGRFPGASDIHQFAELLRDGRSIIGPVSLDRIERTTLDHQRTFRHGGFMNDIDLFDFSFFGMSYDEAKYADPHIRVLLEVIQHAIESSATRREEYSRKRSIVYCNSPHPEYYKHAKEYHPLLYTGNSSDFFANWIARCFDLRGGSIGVNTSCSSFFTSLQLAAREVIYDEADVAFVCAVNLEMFPYVSDHVKDTECRGDTSVAFSTQANGMIYGETTGCLIIKSLKNAVRDGDPVYGVIKAVSINNNGSRSSHIAAPEPSSIADVVSDAWRSAGMKIERASFIEAHGSATQLGDSLEIAGLGIALSDLGELSIPVGTVKANIGHCRTASGFPAIVKALLSIHERRVFGMPGFKEPNPYIDFQRSHVQVGRETLIKETDAIYAGITSMGIGGSNSHVVVSNYRQPGESIHPQGDAFLIPVSARSERSLRSNIKNLLSHNLNNIPLSNISHTLCHGRSHFEYRVAVVTNDHTYLIKELSRLATKPVKPTRPVAKVVCIFSELQAFDDYQPVIEHLLRSFPDFRNAMEGITNRVNDPVAAMLAYQYSFFRLLTRNAIQSRSFVGSGLGKHIISAITGNSDPGEVIRGALNEQRSNAAINLDSLAGMKDVVFLSFGESEIVTKLATVLDETSSLIVPSKDSGTCPLLGLIRDLYTAGVNPMTELIVPHGRKVQLPGYAFDRKRCWIRDTEGPLVQNDRDCNGQLSRRDLTTTQEQLKNIWGDILDIDSMIAIDVDDNFFHLGGSSSQLVEMISHVHKKFGVRINYVEIFTAPTISFIAGKIDGSSQEEAIAKVPDTASGLYQISHSQKRIWVLSQFRNGSRAYKMYAALAITGDFDITRFKRAAEELVARHEILRTIFVENENEILQRVLSDYPVDVHVIDLQDMDRKPAIAKLEAMLRGEYDLSLAPPLEFKIGRIKLNEFVLILSIHHIISDEISLSLMMSDVLSAYGRDPSKEQSLQRLQYRDYAYWHKEKAATQREFWDRQIVRLSNISMELPVDFKRTTYPRFDGSRLEDKIEFQRLALLRSFASVRGTTVHNVLFAIFHLLMSKWCNSSDVVIGTLVAGRSHVDLQNMPGVFMNYLPVTSSVDDEVSFADFFETFDRDLKLIYTNQDYPFEEIARKVDPDRSASKNPVFQTLFNYHADGLLANKHSEKTPGLTIEFLPVEAGTTTLDLKFDVYPAADQLVMRANYNKRLFRQSTIATLVADMGELIDLVLTNPLVPVGKLGSGDVAKLSAIRTTT